MPTANVCTLPSRVLSAHSELVDAAVHLVQHPWIQKASMQSISPRNMPQAWKRLEESGRVRGQDRGRDHRGSNSFRVFTWRKGWLKGF